MSLIILLYMFIEIFFSQKKIIFHILSKGPEDKEENLLHTNSIKPILFKTNL